MWCPRIHEDTVSLSNSWKVCHVEYKQGNRRPHTSPALCTPILLSRPIMHFQRGIKPFPAIGDAAYRKHVGGGLSHGQRQHVQKFGKDRVCGSRDILGDRQTDILVTILHNRSRGRSNDSGPRTVTQNCLFLPYRWRRYHSQYSLRLYPPRNNGHGDLAWMSSLNTKLECRAVTLPIGERKTWRTQTEFCTRQNSVTGQQPQKCVYSVATQETAKHRAKFGWLPLSDVAAVTKPRRETH